MDGREAVQQISAGRQPRGHRGARRGDRAIMVVQRQGQGADPIAARMNLAPAHGGPRPVQDTPQEATAARAPVRDGAGPLVPLASAVVAMLLEAAARDEPGDPDAAGQAGKRAIGPGELDRVLVPALTRLALGLLGRQTRHRPADAAWLGEVAAVLGEESRPPVPGEPPWPDEPLTQSETRVLRYLPTHLSAPEIAAELCVSVNTVKTHMRHLYRKLGAHGRHEAVCRARAIGLLATSLGVRGGESHARRAARDGRAARRPG